MYIKNVNNKLYRLRIINLFQALILFNMFKNRISFTDHEPLFQNHSLLFSVAWGDASQEQQK